MGRIQKKYQDNVSEFKWTRGLAKDGMVDAKTQNALIKASQIDPTYMYWVQHILIKLGHRKAAPNGNYAGTVRAINLFYRKHKSLFGFTIIVDGVLGPKTETALIKASGILPPGHKSKPIPKSKKTSDGQAFSQKNPGSYKGSYR